MTPADRVNAAVAELADALRMQLRAELLAERTDPPALVDVAEAGRLLNLSRTTTYGLLDRPGGIRTHKVGRRRLVARADVLAFASR